MRLSQQIRREVDYAKVIMGTKKTLLSPEQRAKMLGKLMSDTAVKRKSYRERALGLFPHVCARCNCEFSGKKISELTVHHKDHNHENNPADGSNWELLCTYCHDNEHEKFRLEGCYDGTSQECEPTSPFHSAFSELDTLISLPEEESNA